MCVQFIPSTAAAKERTTAELALAEPLQVVKDVEDNEDKSKNSTNTGALNPEGRVLLLNFMILLMQGLGWGGFNDLNIFQI